MVKKNKFKASARKVIDKSKLPEIIEESDRVIIPNVRIYTDFSNGGFDRWWSSILKRCKLYDEEPIMEFSETEKYFCKDVFKFIEGIDKSISTDRPFNIVVTPNTPLSKELGLVLYSSFTEEDWIYAGKSRYD